MTSGTRLGRRFIAELRGTGTALIAIALILASPIAARAVDVGSTLIIPFLASNTGPAAAMRDDVRVPAMMVVNAANTAHRPGLPEFSIKFYDSQLDPKQAVRNYQEIVKSDPVLIMGSFSSTSGAVAPLANRDGIPFIAGFSSVADIARKNRPWVFNTTPDLVVVIGDGVKAWFKREPSVKKVVMIQDQKDLAATVQGDGAAKGVTAAGGTMVGTVTFETGATDFAAIVTRAKAMAPDGIVVASLPADGAAIVQEIRRQGMHASLFLVQSVLGQGFYQTVGNAAEGAYAATTFFVDDPSPAVQEYVKAFEKASGGLKPVFGLSYESWSFAVAALEKAQVVGKSVKDARLAVRKALETVTIKGVTGMPLHFNAEGFCPHPAILLRIGANGKVEKVL